MLTGGQVADCAAGQAAPGASCRLLHVLHGDKGYDTDAIRDGSRPTARCPNIPPKANRIWKNCFSPVLYRARNAIERMFCRLKDFRRIATRYDRLADQLSRRRLPRRNRQLLVMSPDPSRSKPSATSSQPEK